MKVWLLFIFQILTFKSIAQYILNGNATQDATCNCYKLTNPVNFQSGSMWNINKLNLLNSFDFKFDVYFGTNDANGADGIAFILQPVSTSLGMSGGGLGYSGITPSVGILMDTWQNTDVGDPAFDYISIQKNGNVNHNLMADLSPPVPANVANPNIEDGQYHVFRVVWNEPLKSLTVYFDGAIRHTIIVDMVATIFSGDPLVFWGFTAATGGANNLQKICTRLSPNFSFNTASTAYCLGTPIAFNDNSEAFAPILSWLWNFGDGTTFTGQTPPLKVYATPGNYNVSLTISGIDGCVSTPFTQVLKIVTAPTSSFITQPLSCQGQAVQFTDNSNLNNSGPTTSWLWQFADGTTSNVQNPVKIFPNATTYNVQFTANNSYACNANTANNNLIINPTPIVNFTESPTICATDSTRYTANVLFNAPPINTYVWSFNNGYSFTSNSVNTATNNYASAGNFTATLKAINSFGCADSITNNTLVKPKPTFTVNPLAACVGTNTLINIMGNIASPYNPNNLIYSWQVINPTLVASPTYNMQTGSYTFTQAGTHKLKLLLTADNGCATTDSVNINAAPKPILNFNIINSPPLCAGQQISLINLTNMASGALNNINIYWAALAQPTNFTAITNPILGQIFNNTIATFATPITNPDLIKITGLSTLNACTDTITIPYTTNAVPNFNALNSLETCKTLPSFGLETPPVPNIFSGNFALNGNGIVGNNFTPANALIGNNPINFLYTTQAGCTTNVTQNINVQTPVAINAGANLFVLQGGNIMFNATANAAPLNTIYNWSPSNTLTNFNTLTPICTPTQNQIYTITAKTTGGCISKDSLLVNLVLDIDIPNTFTPNADGVNDTWEIKYLNTNPFATIAVFNRYGQQVYNGSATSAPFNGTYKNIALPIGTYYYVITTKRITPYKGYVTIIR